MNVVSVDLHPRVWEKAAAICQRRKGCLTFLGED
jgi:hypothetical protein